MKFNRDHIGLASEDRYVDVERGQLRLFAKAVREEDPIYSDVAAAQAAGYPDIPAPPTFAFCLSNLAPAKVGSMDELIPDIRKTLHGEQSFEYKKMFFAGDRMLIKSRVTDIYEKNGGALQFLVQESEYFNQHGELCVVARQSIALVNA